ncbi:hypothetical protein [Parasphingopyxis lamellibrachiae]|uniref:Uncharacterized protein n=1 Tax=Parasphingopyxis lamellibrachiae TaxID=680125 RepID=A0A3D9FIS8_9SPHN|nr:hypothetical protein [Parasphingopyxis lamellibrachiae]RED17477.1 hypothetical protein DFR46_2524 [Parasphingopyxis lamellibrachiae]
MVIRVVSALVAAAMAFPASAAEKLPYDIANFGFGPSQTVAPSAMRSPGPQIAYDVSGLLYERMPDHVALGYRLEGLTGSVPAYRVVREVGPLEYKLEGLVHAPATGPSLAMAAGAP